MPRAVFQATECRRLDFATELRWGGGLHAAAMPRLCGRIMFAVIDNQNVFVMLATSSAEMGRKQGCVIIKLTGGDSRKERTTPAKQATCIKDRFPN
eukprot:1159131-Pelagomonas_calceolata.AAC.13